MDLFAGGDDGKIEALDADVPQGGLVGGVRRDAVGDVRQHVLHAALVLIDGKHVVAAPKQGRRDAAAEPAHPYDQHLSSHSPPPAARCRTAPAS